MSLLRWTCARINPFARVLPAACACPVQAILSGPAADYYPGEKVIQNDCILEHALDQPPDAKCEKFLHRISPLGYIECTRCSVVCPYGKVIR